MVFLIMLGGVVFWVQEKKSFEVEQTVGRVGFEKTKEVVDVEEKYSEEFRGLDFSPTKTRKRISRAWTLVQQNASASLQLWMIAHPLWD